MNKNTNNTTKSETATKSSMVAENFVEKNQNVKNKGKQLTRQSVCLDDSEEIPVISLIPHVSYFDKQTEDMYEWEEVGHIEYMTVETLKYMWRKNKGYFRNLWLKPMDERVLMKFGLVNIFENYEFLMEESNYSKDNLDKIITAIGKSSVGMKFTLVNKIKQFVSDGIICDVSVIKALGRKLDTDFLAFT